MHMAFDANQQNSNGGVAHTYSRRKKLTSLYLVTGYTNNEQSSVKKTTNKQTNKLQNPAYVPVDFIKIFLASIRVYNNRRLQGMPSFHTLLLL